MTVAEKKTVRRQYPHGGRRARCVRPKGRLDGLPLEQWNHESSARSTVFRPTSVLSGIFTKHYAKNLETWIILSKAQQTKHLSAVVKNKCLQSIVEYKRLSYNTRQWSETSKRYQLSKKVALKEGALWRYQKCIKFGIQKCKIYVPGVQDE